RPPHPLTTEGLDEQTGAAARISLTPPPYVPGPDPTGINNAQALLDFAETLAGVFGPVLDGNGFPVVLGGDCSIVFGPLLALARRGRSGLLFLDGHADFAHPSEEPSGEAASIELGLARRPTAEGLGAVC